MPNTGMLDHSSYQPRNRGRAYVHWMSPWPSQAGYQTARSLRVAEFSRHMMRRSQHSLRPFTPNPHLSMSNSMSPFHTSIKPTCGYFFSRDTDNKKRRIGIPPSDLVSWRSHGAYSARPATRAKTA